MSATTDAIVVRAADPDDAAVVHAMVRELAAHEGAPGSITTTVERWRELLGSADVVVLIARAGRDDIGYVSAVRALHLWSGGDILAMDDLYVRAAWRDRGVGAILLGAITERHTGLAVRWEIDEGNLAGQRVSLRLGARLRRKVVAWRPPPVDDQPSPSR
jgi:GNAT superfamily N-acetyltransferase